MKNIISTFIAFALVFIISVASAKAAEVVYYIPHQDDEVLTFGKSIMGHVNAGHNVHVVLMTDGGASIVQKRLGLTREQFVAARNKEFEYALAIMGVRKENIAYANFPDGKMTQAQASGVMQSYEQNFPGASHKTFTWENPHPDHSILGVALKDLSDKGIITDARYYIQRGTTVSQRRIRDSLNYTYDPILKAAARPYYLVDKKNLRYGVGYASVPKSFQAHAAQPFGYYHK